MRHFRVFDLVKHPFEPMSCDVSEILQFHMTICILQDSNLDNIQNVNKPDDSKGALNAY